MSAALLVDRDGRRQRFVSGEVLGARGAALILVLDCGHSRLAWGLAAERGWLARGAVPNQEIGTLALRSWQNMPRPMSAVGVNVAGEATRVRVEAQLTRWRTMPIWLTASEEACGVRNGYAHPSQSAADRWAALVAARARTLQELFPSPCVVVNARTAISVDALDAEGVFRGGVVLPGLNLMLQALAASTSLRIPPGRYEDFPINNADAMMSGSVQAVCGAIEQMRGRLTGEGVAVKCILGGGAAGEIASHLTPPVEVVDNLVLEGALALASLSAAGRLRHSPLGAARSAVRGEHKQRYHR
jgi:type III pantothenate kinase